MHINYPNKSKLTIGGLAILMGDCDGYNFPIAVVGSESESLEFAADYARRSARDADMTQVETFSVWVRTFKGMSFAAEILPG